MTSLDSYVENLKINIEKLQQELAGGCSRTIIIPQLLVLQYKLNEASPDMRQLVKTTFFFCLAFFCSFVQAQQSFVYLDKVDVSDIGAGASNVTVYLHNNASVETCSITFGNETKTVTVPAYGRQTVEFRSVFNIQNSHWGCSGSQMIANQTSSSFVGNTSSVIGNMVNDHRMHKFCADHPGEYFTGSGITCPSQQERIASAIEQFQQWHKDYVANKKNNVAMSAFIIDDEIRSRRREIL